LEYVISLNPKKCIFGVTKENLLRNIVSNNGIRVDLERVAKIDRIPIPKCVKGIQSFFS
jgi:hypothetical protein